jgi:protein-S-isoprenylcysteine O-methyltransferase Ste14
MSAYRKPHATTAALAYFFLALVVMAWFVRLFAFIAVVIFVCVLIEAIREERRMKRRDSR